MPVLPPVLELLLQGISISFSAHSRTHDHDEWRSTDGWVEKAEIPPLALALASLEQVAPITTHRQMSE